MPHKILLITDSDYRFTAMKLISRLLSTTTLMVLSMSCSQTKHGHVVMDHFPEFYKEGHRGSRGFMPENAIPSMKKAIDDGANIIEVDIQLSQRGIQPRRAPDRPIGPDLRERVLPGRVRGITAGVDGGMEFWIPKGANLFHFVGGARFVHGVSDRAIAQTISGRLRTASRNLVKFSPR